MNSMDLKSLNDLIKTYGREAVAEQINKQKSDCPTELTIIANNGLHPIPKEYIFGELYIASQGNLDFSDISNVKLEIENILIKLRCKLSERNWNRVYLVPFGHSVISMNIKIAVYRALRIETADLFYFGEGEYGLLEINTRNIMIHE